ncbi:MAG: B12-binding domain-containing radical SAM protein [Actinobacteria bacterium]|nr:B12-binding domain-containing radical SAM protein [Actinomycetota bacterium]
MSFERVLFVNPRSHGEWRGIRPHIGLGYLSQAIADNGVAYDVIDMNLGYGFADLRRRIDEFKPDLIGLSLLSLEYRKFYALIAEIKKGYDGVKVVVGGPHVTILKDKVLYDCPEIDFGIVYEGEETLVELCRGDKALHEIEGLMFKDGSRVVVNEQRPFLMDLDKLSFPRYEKFELSRYIREAEIYSSRGCPHQCIFCPNRLISPVFRARSPKHVVDEMEHWYGLGYRQFNFDDDNFNHVRPRVYEICDEIERRGLKGLFLRCSNGIRADRVDRDMLARMREVGFHYIAFGADAGNNRMLEIVKKGETIEQIEAAVRSACELGYDVKLLFVVGTPHETRTDVEDKVRLSLRYPIADVHFYNIIPYPGSELYDWIKENGLFLREPEEYLNDVTCIENTPVFETPELRARERVKLFKYLKGVQKLVHRNAITSLLDRLGPLSPTASYFLANSVVEKLFYQSFAVRKLAEKLRYGKAVDNSRASFRE